MFVRVGTSVSNSSYSLKCNHTGMTYRKHPYPYLPVNQPLGKSVYRDPDKSKLWVLILKNLFCFHLDTNLRSPGPWVDALPTMIRCWLIVWQHYLITMILDFNILHFIYNYVAWIDSSDSNSYVLFWSGLDMLDKSKLFTGTGSFD